MRQAKYSIDEAIGKKFGRLTLVSRTTDTRRVLVRCDCGVEKIIWWKNLRSGMTKSCGCLTTETALRNDRKYFYKGQLLYRVCGSNKQLYAKIVNRIRTYGMSAEDAVDEVMHGVYKR